MSTSPSEPPGSVVKVPPWLIGLLVTCLGSTFVVGLKVSAQVGEASAEIRGSVERVAAIESRLNVLAETQGRLSVVEAKIEADRERINRLEQRDDRVAGRP